MLLLNFDIHGEGEKRHEPEGREWQEEAIAAVYDSEYARAEELLKRALEVAPDAPDILQNLASAYKGQGRRAEAEAIIRHVHERHPDYLFGCTEMARLCVQQGKLDEAHALLDPLLSRTRLHYSELAALAIAYIELNVVKGNREGARSWLELWDSADPEHPMLDPMRQHIDTAGQPGSRLRRLFQRA